MSTGPKDVANSSIAPLEPAFDECLMPSPLERLLPTDQEVDRAVQRFPALTATGLYPYEKYQREDDYVAKRLLFHEHQQPTTRRPLISIGRADVRRDIAVTRFFLRSNCGEWIGTHDSYNLQIETARWARKPMWHGAVIAAAFLEPHLTIERAGSVGVFVGLRLGPALHFRLKIRAEAALSALDAGLACVLR